MLRLAYRSSPFPQDRKGRQFELCSQRIPTGAGCKTRGKKCSNSAHRETLQGPVKASGRENTNRGLAGSPHGGTPARKSHALSVVCGGH